MNRRQGRRAAAAAGALAVLALMIRLVPVRIPDARAQEGDQRPLPSAPPEFPVPSGTAAPYQGIVDGNLFAPDRTPPPTAVDQEEVPAARPVQALPPSPRYRLSGIVQGPDGFVALIDADPVFPGAELYQVGDSVGPWLLEQATDTLVVLRRGRTTQTLRLDTISGRIPR